MLSLLLWAKVSMTESYTEHSCVTSRCLIALGLDCHLAEQRYVHAVVSEQSVSAVRHVPAELLTACLPTSLTSPLTRSLPHWRVSTNPTFSPLVKKEGPYLSYSGLTGNGLQRTNSG